MRSIFAAVLSLLFLSAPLAVRAQGAIFSAGAWTNNYSGTVTGTGTAGTDLPTYGAEVLSATGWTSAGWTGSWIGGWIHTTGNTTALAQSTAAAVGTKYQIAWTVTGRTAGTFVVGFGGQTNGAVSATGTFGPTATTVAGLTITPTTDFNGAIVVSIKPITAGSTAMLVLRDSGGVVRSEVRAGTGTNNTANGVNALGNNTTGTNNTANGVNALGNNTTGTNNTANGVDALGNNTTGVYNTANGVSALYSNTTGVYNTANGVSALYSNTTGVYNTANGVGALYSNTTGTNNTANGVNALHSNTTGVYNTANGVGALYSNTTGVYNTANGWNVLYSNTTGVYNTANGVSAGRFLADGVTANQASSNSVFEGSDTRANAAGGTNEIVIGSAAIGSGSNTATLGNTSVVATYLRGSVNVSLLALPTCGAAAGNTPEGGIVMVAGAATVRTKMCVCTFTPTGAVYAWVNALANNSGTGVGTATTCP